MPRARGFTLLELLVVMVLMALLTAAAVSTLNFAVSDEDAETEARRIGALIELGAEEALLTGREYGIRLQPDKLEFLVFDDETSQWRIITEDEIFYPRPLPEHLDFSLILEGQAIKLPGAAENPEEETPEPQVMLFSSGQITPFELGIRDLRDDAVWRVNGDLLGRVDIENAGT